MLLPGSKLSLKNVLPDDPERNKGQWTAFDDSIVGPSPGGLSDPRCLFDPPGTVKAMLRFASQTSGHDSGPIGLPCENWKLQGPTPTRNYEYRDRELDEGPCSLVRVTDGSSIEALCRGRRSTAALPYDLEIGVSDGVVEVGLVIGQSRYCSAFPPASGKDGSDGRKFLGTSSAAPAACLPGLALP
jgi:hypothetical protein